MKRSVLLLFAVGGAFALVLAACPVTPPPGDVQLGTYLVNANPQPGTCSTVGAVADGGAFDFSAKLGADSDGGTVYLTVSQPPGNVAQQPRRGTIDKGRLLFQNEQMQDISTCGCQVQVTETIGFVPVVGPPDGGTWDGGPDGGAYDAGPGPVPGLPPPDAIRGLTGSIGYQLDDPGGCPKPTKGADGGVVGCNLPCGFGYGLTGTRQK